MQHYIKLLRLTLLSSLTVLMAISCSKEVEQQFILPESPYEVRILYFEEPYLGKVWKNRLVTIEPDGSNPTIFPDTTGVDASEDILGYWIGSWAYYRDKIVVNVLNYPDPMEVEHSDDLFLISRDNTEPFQLTFTPGIQEEDAEISPDGTKILFHKSDDDGDYELFICDIDGSNPRQLTFFENAISPYSNWSIDGKKVYFTSNRDGLYHLYSIRIDGTDLKKLSTDENFSYFNARVSNDGKKVVFSDSTPNGLQIFTMDINGSNIKQITAFSNNVTTPRNTFAVWSPDGAKIAFLSNKDKTESNFLVNDLYVMDSDGTNAIRLTNTRTLKKYVDWK